MDTAIKAGTITVTDTAAVVGKLVRFYSESAISEETAGEFRNRLQKQLVQAHGELLRPEFSLNARLVRTLRDAQVAFLDQNAKMFDARVRQKRIREIHGDLKPEHICLGPDPQIIDRLEFRGGRIKASAAIRPEEQLEFEFPQISMQGLGRPDGARADELTAEITAVLLERSMSAAKQAGVEQLVDRQKERLMEKGKEKLEEKLKDIFDRD